MSFFDSLPGNAVRLCCPSTKIRCSASCRTKRSMRVALPCSFLATSRTFHHTSHYEHPIKGEGESGRPDLNRRRPAWEAGILPLNYARPRTEKKNPGLVLLSHGINTVVPSALEGLTAVFGMGTGVAPPPLRPG
jgi:hypothetical protein